MQVDPTGTSTANTNAATTSQTSASPSTLDYDAFLKLLVAQLKNQDPTEPMDPSQQMAQLASFANVEQSIKANAKLDALMTSMALSQADGIIGRTITSADGEVSGEVTALRVVSGGAVAVLEDGTEIELGPGVTVT
jgi:flagellar basal-body rod modification protein FlgD